MKTALIVIAAIWLGIGVIALALLWLYGLSQGDATITRATVFQTVLGWPYYGLKLLLGG